MNTCKNSVKQDGGRSCWSMRGTFEKLTPWLVEQGLISERKTMKYKEYQDLLEEGMIIKTTKASRFASCIGEAYKITDLFAPAFHARKGAGRYDFIANCKLGPLIYPATELEILTEADGVTPYRQKNEFKVGDRVVGLCERGEPYMTTCAGYTAEVTATDKADEYDIELNKQYWVKSKYFKKINDSATIDTFSINTLVASWDKGINKMAQDERAAICSEEIPKKLSVMERLTASDDDKVLIKAGYLADGELTYKAKEVISALQFESFKAKLVEQAQMELDEAKE